MKKLKLTIIALLIAWCGSVAFGQDSVLRSELYGTGNWDADSLGSHRVVVTVNEKSDLVLSHVDWRRKDFAPEKKGILIVDATTGKLVRNVLPVTISRESGDILFQPETAPGQYYIYYLKYKAGGRTNYPQNTYPAFKQLASSDWLAKAEAAKSSLQTLPKASLVQFQAVDAFNSFYPMEIIATRDEVKNLISKNSNSGYLTFPEVRENSIRMTTDLPAKWIADGPKTEFLAKALKGEYFTFQIGVYPVKAAIADLKITFNGLNKSGKQLVAPASFTCFNLEGTDWEGKPFTKKCAVEKGKVQPLWIGVQVPEKIEAGTYDGEIRIKPSNMEEKVIRIKLQIDEKTIVASGDNDPSKMTRLRWLNSTIANNDETVAPYTPLVVKNQSVFCLGREVVLNNSGFPENIKSHFSGSVTKILPEARELLSAPVRLVVEKDGQELKAEKTAFKFAKKAEGAVEWTMANKIGNLSLRGKARMEFDGNIDYQLILTATEDMTVNDIRLEIPFKPEATKYMMGLGQRGGFRPEEINWKWKVENNQDGPWIGDVNIGLQARFRDNNYSRPLNTNFYLSKPLNMPVSWFNNGNGGITVKKQNQQTVLLSSYSGNRKIKKGEQLYFYFNLLITPFHTIDTREHWSNRYFHSYKPISEIMKYGANTINIHHANQINPFINYPFLRPDLMKAYIDSAHAENLKVKIYYTVRELTNRAPELFMLRSLGDEVLSHGPGGGFSWLQEHLDSNYIAAWFVPDLKDAAVINSGISRWHNFYVEGLNWLVKNIGIDGLYIDDIAFDRTTMERVRKTLKKGNPGALIDLHSANQFNPRDGFANSANLYLEHFPFIDRLWFGEYFDYNLAPDFWLIESSGIPFGLMGEMLQDGGNPWRGMLFGMTARAPWSGDPAPIWKFWDQFGIQDAEMIGFWDPACAVTTNNEKVKATVYTRKGETLIALGNWDKADQEVSLNIDWKKLGINPETATITGPDIDRFQPELSFKINQSIKIPGGKGYLVIVK